MSRVPPPPRPAAADPDALADPHHGGHWLCVRHLCAAGDAVHRKLPDEVAAAGRRARERKKSAPGSARCSSFRPSPGGIFGLLGGYLTDIFGRRRILTWSILLYAFSAFASGYSTSLTMLLILRS